MQELIQADPSKKLPKIDMGELPPVTIQQPPRQATPTLPAMTLTPPMPPGGAAASPVASSSVGRASDNTVNATGAVQSPLAPAGYDGPMPIANVRTGDTGPANVPNSIVGGIDSKGRPTLVPNAPDFNVAPQSSPLTLPAMRQATIQNPVPPQQISSGGLHLLTLSDKSAMSDAASREEINRLQQQYPDKSPEDLAYFAKHGEFPKDEFSLSPGEARFKNGKEVARNTAAKPGEKTGYSYELSAGGAIKIKDNRTGADLSRQQIDSTPEAKAVYDSAVKERDTTEARQDERDEKKFANALTLTERHEESARRSKVYGEAVDAAKKARPMVDVLNASEEYMTSGKFTPRQDLALIVRAVRAMNPGTVRLPQKELELELHAGSYGDRFRRWFDTATGGVLPDDQRQDLMNVIRSETTKTATTAAEDWRESFKGTPEEEPPTYLRRFEKKAGDNIAPEGATHEVYAADGKTLIGHTDGKKFIPLGGSSK